MCIRDSLSASSELRPHLALDLRLLHALLDAGLEKFKTFAPVLEVDTAQSQCVKRIERWLGDVGPSLERHDPPQANAAA